jgi:hypothetical protein
MVKSLPATDAAACTGTAAVMSILPLAFIVMFRRKFPAALYAPIANALDVPPAEPIAVPI